MVCNGFSGSGEAVIVQEELVCYDRSRFDGASYGFGCREWVIQ